MLAVISAGALVACGGGSSSSTTTSPPGDNVQAIAVNGGPVAGVNYEDAAFTSVTLCVPNTSSCQTVDGVLVDTGSVGLRILGSALSSLSLPQLAGSGGTDYYNCVNFVDGSYLWGEVAQADVEMAGEKASSASIQVIENPAFTIPTACSNGGLNEDNQSALGANGILGVGSYPQDCGPACATSTSPDYYFTCASSGSCQGATIPVTQQLINPVIGFTKDNNGVIIALQSVDGEAATATGNMIFGIGTESNNALGSATVYTLDSDGFFTTNFNSQSLTASFIDSGSNSYDFPDSSIPVCGSNTIAPGFYCPTSTLNLSAQTVGANGAQGTVGFSVDNAVDDFTNFGGVAALANLAGSNASDKCGPGISCGFDWGLPFFFGRNIFVSIDGQSVPSGVAAPWWAY